MAILVTVWALGRAIRATIHFALLPTRALQAHKRPSRLSNASYRATSIAVDAAFVVFPVLMFVTRWS